MRLPALRFVLLLTMCALPAVDAQESAQRPAAAVPQWFVSGSYGYQSFFDDIPAWHVASASLGNKSSAGTFIGRVNYARRLGADGVQGELDAYPRLSQSVYAYLNLGYSDAAVFPEWRSGAELFTTLPDAFEASLGYRQLRFSGTPVTLFTGALGKYRGNYWFSLRPYIRSKDSGVSASANLQVRRYYEDGDHYIGGRLGVGSTPSDQLIADQAVLRTNSFTAGLLGSTSVTRTVLGTWSAVYEYEQLPAARTRKSITIDLGARLLF